MTQSLGTLTPISDLYGCFMSMDTDIHGIQPYTYKLKDSFLICTHVCLCVCECVHAVSVESRRGKQNSLEGELEVAVSCLVPGTKCWSSVKTAYAFNLSHFSRPLKDICSFIRNTRIKRKTWGGRDKTPREHAAAGVGFSRGIDFLHLYNPHACHSGGA